MRERITAEQLRENLTNDAAYREMQKRRQLDAQSREDCYRRTQAPLVGELRDAGYQIADVWDLVNSARPYPSAIPILLKHLSANYPDRVREGIARALAVKYAEYAWPLLLKFYKLTEPRSDFKFGLAAALAETVSKATIRDLADIASDPRNGGSRVLLLRRLRMSRSPLARQAIESLRADPDLFKEISSWKGYGQISK